uniref:S26 family signal peptidase n=1 Tax=Sphingomonas sp. GlSt437 TaxID=3389970 RepID=UPI003A8A898A
MTRFGYVLATVTTAELFAALFVTVAIVQPRPRLIWNASASAPIGLYRLERDAHPSVDTLVAVLPPAPIARWLATRRYLAEGVPLLKHVAARPGQRICRTGAVVSVDARPVAVALSRDSRGRPLPVWRGCRTVRTGELLLLNASVRDSMDGRYLGALPAAGLLGRAIPLLTPRCARCVAALARLSRSPRFPPCQRKGVWRCRP